MTIFQGLRGTGQFGVDFRPKNYRETYTMLEPNGNAPLNALLAMGNSESTNDPHYKNFEDELPARALKINNGVGYDAVATSLTVDAGDSNKFANKDAVIVNMRTGEVMHVTADTTGTTLTVQRNIGGTAHTIVDNDDLIVAGHAAMEGGDVQSAVSFDASVVTNYTQIFRTPWTLTNTQDKTYLRTGNKGAELEEKALKLHMSDIERAHFFSRLHEENASTAQPTRFTNGLVNAIVTNKFDVSAPIAGINATGGTLTEQEFDRLLIDTIFAYGSDQKVAFCGSKVIGHIHELGKNRWQPTEVTGTYGVNMTGAYRTPAGTLITKLHPQFRQIPQAANMMIIVDMAYINYRHMDGRDTMLLENRQGNGVDGQIHEFLTECGLELTQDKVHAVIQGWDSV